MSDEQFAAWCADREWFSVIDADARRVGNYEGDGQWHEYTVRDDGTIAASESATPSLSARADWLSRELNRRIAAAVMTLSEELGRRVSALESQMQAEEK